MTQTWPSLWSSVSAKEPAFVLANVVASFLPSVTPLVSVFCPSAQPDMKAFAEVVPSALMPEVKAVLDDGALEPQAKLNVSTNVVVDTGIGLAQPPVSVE